MADRPRFGPAGIPLESKLLKLHLHEVPEYLHEKGLDALEYEAIFWGTKPQIRKEEAEKLRLEASKNDIWLSMHGSYFINLFGDSQVAEASKKRLVTSVIAASWIGAKVLVFHPGYYGQNPHSEALKKCISTLNEIVSELKSLGIKNVQLGLETSGRRAQFGSLEEILGSCVVEQTQPVIDWAHLHARDAGRFSGINDYRLVIEQIETSLGTEAVENLHCHFSKVEFSLKGERRHHTLDETRYGPRFEMLAKVIMEFRLKPVFICESPFQDIDALKMKKVWEQIANSC